MNLTKVQISELMHKYAERENGLHNLRLLSQAKEQSKSGTPLFGKDGAFHRVLEDFLNAAMEGEMDSHLHSEKMSGNRRLT